jgi:hypothetical protein
MVGRAKKENDVEQMEVLRKVAGSPDWDEFLLAFKIPLRVYMREWYETASEVEEIRKRKRNESERLQERRNLFQVPQSLANGIDIGSENNLLRDDLVEKLWNHLKRSRYVVISSSPATGKTSLLQLLNSKYFISKYISCKDYSDPYDLLLSAGIDLRNREIVSEHNNDVVIALDDAQNIYWNKDFWRDLVKDGIYWLPRNIGVIISATHNLAKYNISPVEISSLPRISKSDLLLSDEEAAELIDLTCYTEICIKTSQSIKHVIIRECSGVIGVIRLSVMKLCERFYQSSPTESEVLQYFFF